MAEEVSRPPDVPADWERLIVLVEDVEGVPVPSIIFAIETPTGERVWGWPPQATVHITDGRGLFRSWLPPGDYTIQGGDMAENNTEKLAFKMEPGRETHLLLKMNKPIKELTLLWNETPAP